MEYLGSLGRLIPLRCASQERSQASSRYRESFTVEGRRRVQIVPDAPRTWDVSWDLAYPRELAALSGFTSGAWGNGPWHWVPVLAQVGNALTPREAELLDFTQRAEFTAGGPVRGADGTWAARSIRHDFPVAGWRSAYSGVPVMPGKPVTWAVDVEGDSPGITMQFQDVARQSLGQHVGAGSGAGMQRVSVSAVAPPGAASVVVGVRNTTTRFTRPQVTWTAGPVPFSAGHGCRAAVVDGFSEDLIVANSFGTYSQVGFTVMEVG